LSSAERTNWRLFLSCVSDYSLWFVLARYASRLTIPKEYPAQDESEVNHEALLQS
jgi:hypothetical protein